jgi:vacuolar-type H+-ATPase subunit E/Vma4
MSGMSTENLNSESIKLTTQVIEALQPVVGIITEVRDEISERLGEVDAREYLENVQELLKTHVNDLKIGQLVQTAIRGLQAGVDLLDGKLDANFFEAVVEVVAFAVQVQQYIACGHYLGDLLKVAGKVAIAIDALYTWSTGVYSAGV